MVMIWTAVQQPIFVEEKNPIVNAQASALPCYYLIIIFVATEADYLQNE